MDQRAEEFARSLGERIAALEAENRRLRDALRVLVERLDFVHANPAYKEVWYIALVHGFRYQGPKYVVELEAAKKALAGEVE